MDDMIVNLTPTGMVPTKQDTPHVPISVNEIVDDVLGCCEIGVTMVHLHARDADGQPDWRPEPYADIITSLRNVHPDLVVCVTCSGRNFGEFEKRSAVLEIDGDAKPDFASLTLSSLNFSKSASVNAPGMVISLAEKMGQRGIRPELEVFDLGMVNYARYLIGKAVIGPPYYFNLIFGNIATAQADLLSVASVTAQLPSDSLYSFGGVGVSQQTMNSLGVLAADGVRVGLEDNIWYDAKRTQLATNRSLLQRVKALADIAGRRIMAPAELRRRLGLDSAGPGLLRAA